MKVHKLELLFLYFLQNDKTSYDLLRLVMTSAI